ncbi:Nramp family divalent metal transporter [Metabacillus arenae]|uniref:Nramp family divalent metal transporter n=1 Tax=Metabacillus arenae TaxID=2771434 RepID=A0A926NPK4_9BACI|nr:Nramp family divalent metal transporter [Metabacillus arenae]MBD1381732.1 Nramp family divalent metal transporter [Metabacillus arenae]
MIPEVKPEQITVPTPPKTIGQKLKNVGPGFVTAATGVGTGDLIAALVAGVGFGTTLGWAIILGALLKFYLTEGIGRWHLATGKTILEGWHSLGRWATGYFGIYSIIWGFLYGAAAASTCALMMTAMFPIMPLWAWAIIHLLAGFALIWTGKYIIFERVMLVLIGIMFVTVVGTAVVLLPDIGSILNGILVPRLESGSFLLVLGLIGGVGGTITMASYGYWLQEKKWRGKSWISMMRVDNSVAYIVTAIFTLSLLIVGAEFLFGSGIKVEDEQGLITLSVMLADEFGSIVQWMFLLGAWSAAFSSLLGVWNGVPYLFADFVRTLRRKENVSDKPVSEKDPAYRFYLIWLTFPPMLLLFLGKPVGLVIIHGALGAIFMPFLAFTLIWLLNSKRVDIDYKNGWVTNAVLGSCILLFIGLAVVQFSSMF